MVESSNNNNNEVINKVVNMVNDSYVNEIVDKFGLKVMNVSWEDNARDKDSCYGPCISDMTLNVLGYPLPIIRYPNYTDLTWDVPMKKIPVIVGNEKGRDLQQISLKKYLKNFDKYLHEDVGRKINLLRDSDSHVIMSSQACFLPITDNEVNFSVSIYNYQSTRTSPSVLTIVSCASGTSATVHDGGCKGLYFNKNGEKCYFVGQRLSDNRKQKGEVDLYKKMSAEEKQQNVLLIIQVPIRKIRDVSNSKGEPIKLFVKTVTGRNISIDVMSNHTIYEVKLAICDSEGIPPDQQRIVFSGMVLDDDETLEEYGIGDLETIHLILRLRGGYRSDVEDAIIKIGESIGEFEELKSFKNIERDPRFPVRATLQFYKATSNGLIEEEDVKEIYDQIQESKKNADFIGSLVVSNSNRPTEHVKKPTKYNTPVWWDDFWQIYKSKLSRFTKKSAEQFIFKNGRFTDKGMSKCEKEILSLIESHPDNNLPSWDII